MWEGPLSHRNFKSSFSFNFFFRWKIEFINFFNEWQFFLTTNFFLVMNAEAGPGPGVIFGDAGNGVGEQFSKMLGPGTGWILKMPGSGSFSKNEQGPGRSLVPQTPENMLPNALSNPIALLLGTSGCTHLAHCTDSRTASLYLILAQVSAVPSTLYLPKPKKNWIRRKLPTSGIEDFFGGHYVTAHYDLKSPKCGQIQ